MFMDPVVLRAGGPDLRVCGQVRARIGAGARVVDCDAAALHEPDARTVDALLRLTLVARRCGGRIRLLDAPARLVDLLAACGLGEIVEVVARPPPGQPKKTSASA
jgi:hypothetical protein